MSYVDNNLATGENVIYRAKLHWIVFFWPVMWLAIAILVISKSGNVGPQGGVGFLTLLAIVTGVSALIKYRTSEFALTNKQVIMKTGLIKRQSLEVLLNKVEGVTVDQSVLGRILGFGAITVNGTGGTRDPFRKISSPLEFRKQVQEQLSGV